jgi:hypothetical protein
MRKSALDTNILSNQYTSGVVNVQNLDGDFARARFSDKNSALPAKVTLPGLYTRMEQGYDFFFQEAGQVGAFGGIAFWACETEVLRIVTVTVLFGKDVLDMKSEEIEIVLMHPAIFAAVFGPLPNQRPGARIDN